MLQASLPGVPKVSDAQVLAHLRTSFTTLTVTGVTSGTVTSPTAGSGGSLAQLSHSAE